MRHLQALHFNTIEDDILWMLQSVEAEARAAASLDPLHRDREQAMPHLSHPPSFMAKLQLPLNSWCSCVEQCTEHLLQMGYQSPQWQRCPPGAPLPCLHQLCLHSPGLHLPSHRAAKRLTYHCNDCFPIVVISVGIELTFLLAADMVWIWDEKHF